MKWKESMELLVCSDRQYDFYNFFNLPIRLCKGDDASSIISEFRPASIFTGTSYTSKLELHFIKEAVKQGIPCASFVDHYTGFDVRFGVGDDFIIPDEIYVLDHQALSLAVHAGLPEDRIRITGNPYQEFLLKWRSQLTKQQVFEQLGIQLTDCKTILFAPDPLSNAGGIKKFGTDEVVVLSLLLEAFRETGKQVQFLIKTHPNQSIDYIKSALTHVPTNLDLYLVDSKKDAILNDLIQHVDLVVGMFSNLLTEAEHLGATTLRVLADIHSLPPVQSSTSGYIARTTQECKGLIKQWTKNC